MLKKNGNHDWLKGYRVAWYWHHHGIIELVSALWHFIKLLSFWLWQHLPKRSPSFYPLVQHLGCGWYCSPHFRSLCQVLYDPSLQPFQRINFCKSHIRFCHALWIVQFHLLLQDDIGYFLRVGVSYGFNLYFKRPIHYGFVWWVYLLLQKGYSLICDLFKSHVSWPACNRTIYAS